MNTLNKIANYVFPIGNRIAGSLRELPKEADFKIFSNPRFNSVLKDFITKGLQRKKWLRDTNEFVDASSFFFGTASETDGALIYSIDHEDDEIILVNLDAMANGDFGVFKEEFFDVHY